MGKHKVLTTDAEIERALQRAKEIPNEPRVVTAEYKPGAGLDLLILKLSDGRREAIPREDLQGLAGADPKQIARIEILGNGTGLRWPELDVDHYVPELLKHIYGTKRWMGQIGRSGGSAKTEAKQRASRENGRKGGRPRKELERAS